MRTLLLAGIALAIGGPAFAANVPSSYVSTNGLDILATGSGVVIGPHDVLTASHVIEECTAINVFGRDAYVVAHDESNDLALVRTKDTWASWASFSNQPIRAGDSVVIMGYPLSGLLADTANVSPGFVSALAGMKNDSRFLQITAPVQEGNSGGAAYDHNGGVVGIIIGQLGSKFVETTGVIPQNVNFALKAEIVRTFLDGANFKYQSLTSTPYKKLEPADIGEQTRPFTVKIECYGHEQKNTPPPEQPKIAQPPVVPPPTTPSGPAGPNNMTVYRVVQNLMLRAEPNKNAWNVLSAYAPYDYIPEGVTFTFGPNPKCMYGSGQYSQTHEVWCHVWYVPKGQPQTAKMWGLISAHFLRDNNGVLLACRYNTPDPECVASH